MFNILMNKPMFDYIAAHGLCSKAGQEKYSGMVSFAVGSVASFPVGSNPITTAPPRIGAIMLRVSYRIPDPEKDKNLITQFQTAERLIYFPGPPVTEAGPACVEKRLAVVRFGHEPAFAPQWVWSSFEHVKNAPDEAGMNTSYLLRTYNFYNTYTDCPARNDTPPVGGNHVHSTRFQVPCISLLRAR